MLPFDKYILIWKLLPEFYHLYNRDGTHLMHTQFSLEKLFIYICLAHSSVCVHTAHPKCACYRAFFKDFSFIKLTELKILGILFILHL